MPQNPLGPVPAYPGPQAQLLANRQRQLEIQARLLNLASSQLDFLEHGQVNPQVTQDMANLAIAAGLTGPNLNLQG
ncbi:MAG TPA: hypothetical protein V6C52_06865 [Coleofasciculaceae cyanobacterium]